MPKPLVFSLLILSLTLFSGLNAAIYNITSESDFSSLPSTLAAGDVITIQDGTYHSVGRTLTAAGTALNPVRMYAVNPGNVYFSGGTQFVLRGSHMVISGLAFDGDVAAGGPRYSSGVFRFDTNSSDFTLRDCLFRNYDTGVPSSGAFWIQINGYRHTVEYCSFIGKDSEDPIINIIPNEDEDAGGLATKDIPRRHLIRHCYFADRTNIGQNGFEGIRIGESKYQMYDMSTVVEYCLFERAIYGENISNYEPEVISSKSRNNIYRYNTFRENKGGLVLRHGDDNVIDGNFFFGVTEAGSESMGAGVRIIGLRHVIKNNYFENIGGTGLRAAICLMKGSGEYSEDSTSNGYESPGSAKIFHNTIINSEEPFALGATTSSSGDTAPNNVEIRNNVVQSQAGDGPVIDFNSSNGWNISQLTFSGNYAYHSSGIYGTMPASGFATGSPVDHTLDATLGFHTPQTGSPVIDAVGQTTPATVTDLRSILRGGSMTDAGSFETGGTGISFNRPLFKEDVGPSYSYRVDQGRVPTLLEAPESQSVFEGGAVSLSVTSESNQAVTYQWSRDGADLTGETSSIYAIPSATPADEGSYVVAVTNASGRTLSYPVTLTVAPAAPVISAQPISNLVGLGGDVTFTVESDGIPPFTYQWLKNGVPILPAETNQALVIANAQAADAGEYSVIVTNVHGSDTSVAASLTVESGTVLLNDSFSDDDRTNQGLPDSAQWYASGSGLSMEAGALSLPAGRHALAFFKNSGVQAINVGEELTATFTLNFSSVGPSSGGFRVGLFNSNGAARPDDSSNDSFSAYDGYIATSTAQFPDSNSNPSAPITFRQKNPGVRSSLISTTGSGVYSTVEASPAVSQSFVAGVNYTVMLVAARPATDTVKLTYAVTGGDFSGYGFTTEDTSDLVTGFDGFAVLSTSSNGSSYTIDNVSIVHRPIPAAVTPSSWRFANFGTTENAGIAANSFDADLDGISNLFEFLYGLNPNVPDAIATMTADTVDENGQTYLTYTFTRDTDVSGATLMIRATGDLLAAPAGWDVIDPDGANQIGSSTAGKLETVTVRDNVPIEEGTTARFMKLEASDYSF